MRWTPPIELTPREAKLCGRLEKHRRFYRFLRLHRHRLFDDAFQARLATMYADTPRGTAPTSPALLATVVLLQAYAKASDDDAVQLAETDARWQLVLDCLGAEEAPFGKATLVDFRARLIAAGLHDALLRRTVDLAKETRDFGYKQAAGLRVALDSAPLEGAGKVEDTLNLLGHALRLLLHAMAAMVALTPHEVITQAGLTVLAASSTKAGLDQEWEAPDATSRALRTLLGEVERLTSWTTEQHAAGLVTQRVAAAQAQVTHLLAQNTTVDEQGERQMAVGVAPERQISIADPEMRHGRKSETVRINGYKEYAVTDLDHGLTLAAGVLPANAPEAAGADKVRGAVEAQGSVARLFIDRAFLASEWVKDLTRTRLDAVVCRPLVAHNQGRFTKQDFTVDLTAGTVQCPAGHLAVIGGATVHFATPTCGACPLRAQCQASTAKEGRTIHLGPQEPLLQHLTAQAKTPQGREQLRERVPVEHALAHQVRRRSPRARYRGVAKNDFDSCRSAAVNNLLVIDRRLRQRAEAEKEAA